MTGLAILLAIQPEEPFIVGAELDLDDIGHGQAGAGVDFCAGVITISHGGVVLQLMFLERFYFITHANYYTNTAVSHGP